MTSKQNVVILKKTCKGTWRQVFIRVYSFVNCCPSPLFSGSTLPPPPLQCVNKYTVYCTYTYTVCRGGGGGVGIGSGPQTDMHLTLRPFTDFLDDDILHCLLLYESYLRYRYSAISDTDTQRHPIPIISHIRYRYSATSDRL
jgi:hypothetical protein